MSADVLMDRFSVFLAVFSPSIEEITAEFLGDLSGRFNYELVCDFGQRIPRVYTRDGQVEAVKDYDEDCHIDYLK